MCDLCEEREDGTMESCQDCGRLICFDVESHDDTIAPAYVTSAGDLYCRPCGLAIDQAERESEEDCVDPTDYGGSAL